MVRRREKLPPLTPQVTPSHTQASCPHPSNAVQSPPVATNKSKSKSAKKTPDPRNIQLQRLLELLALLSRTGGLTLKELAQRYDTTTRTIRRDLDALRSVGFDVEEDEGEDASSLEKRWRINTRQSLTKLRGLLDAQHYLALRMAMGALDGAGRATHLFGDLEDLADKIDTAVGPKGRKQLADIERCLYSYEKFRYESTPPEVLWPLIRAISEERICTVTYRAINKPKATRFRILPLRIFVHDGAIYLHAYAIRADNVIALNLHRLDALQVKKEKLAPPKNYKPGDWEDAAFSIYVGQETRRFRLHFDADVAPYIRERNWHPSQKLRELGEGRVELTFRCTDSPELRGWIAQWRASVTVLEPSEVKTEFRELGRFLRDTYGD